MNDAFKPNGMWRAPTPLKKALRLAPVLSALLLANLLGGCVTTGTRTSVTDTEGQCAAWRRITYSHQDTPPTALQVREHNATGRYLRCWK